MLAFNNPQIKDDLLLIHAEDAAFSLSQRALAVEAPNYRLLDVYDLEQRLLGHLDALVCAGQAGLTVAMAEAEAGDRTAVAVLFCVALRLQQIDIAHNIEFPTEDRAAFCRRLAQAARWCTQQDLAQIMSDWMTGSPAQRLTALEICCLHRVDPRHHLPERISDLDPVAQSSAIRLAGMLGRADCLELLRDTGGDAATLAAVRLGDERAAMRLHDASTFPTDPEMARCFAETFPIALTRGEATDAIQSLLANPDTRRWGTVAIGSLGWSAGLQSLLTLMSEPLHARVAVSAFEQITGLYVAHEELELDDFPEDPEGPDFGVTESFIDGNTPWPDLEKFERWIGENQSRYASDDRLLLGVSAWTFEGAPDPWVKYQARHRWIATTQALKSPETPMPNYQSPVHIDGLHFTRRW